MPENYSFPQDVPVLRQDGYKMAQRYYMEAQSLADTDCSVIATLAARLIESYEAVQQGCGYFKRVRPYLKDLYPYEEPRSVIAEVIRSDSCCFALAIRISLYGSESDQEIFTDFYNGCVREFDGDLNVPASTTDTPEIFARKKLQACKELVALYSNDYKGNPECARWLTKILSPQESVEATMNALQDFGLFVNKGPSSSSTPVLKL